MAEYLRKDIEGGFLTQESDINYFKRTQFIEVMDNKLLGDFNEQGEYVTSADIIKELIKLKKIKTYSYGNTIFCQSASNVGGFGRIEFAIKLLTNVDEAKCVAHLELLENISKANGYFSNTNSVLIATFTSNKYATFAKDCFEAFGVYDTSDGGKIEDDFEPESIIARKRYLQWLKTQLESLLINTEKDLLDRRIKALRKSKVGEDVYREFLDELKKLKGVYIKEQSQSYFRYANDVLDRLIQLRSNEIASDLKLLEELKRIGIDCAKRTKAIITDFVYKNSIEEQKATEPVVLEIDKNTNNSRFASYQPEERKPKEEREVVNREPKVDKTVRDFVEHKHEHHKPMVEEDDEAEEIVDVDEMESSLETDTVPTEDLFRETDSEITKAEDLGEEIELSE